MFNRVANDILIVDRSKYDRLGHCLHIYAVGWRITDEGNDIWARRFLNFKSNNLHDVQGGKRVLKESVLEVIRRENFALAQTGLVTALSSASTKAENGSALYRAAQWIADQIDIKWQPDLLTKKLHPRLHSLSTGAQRSMAVSNTYKCVNINLDNLIVLDDFVTRGDTLKEISRAVHQSNSNVRVVGLVLGKHESRIWALRKGLSIPPENPNIHIPAQWEALWTGHTFRQENSVILSNDFVLPDEKAPVPEGLKEGRIKQSHPDLIIDMGNGYEGRVKQDEVDILKKINFPINDNITLDVYSSGLDNEGNLNISIIKALERETWQSIDDNEILSGEITHCDENGVWVDMGLLSEFVARYRLNLDRPQQLGCLLLIGFIARHHLDLDPQKRNLSTLKGRIIPCMVIGRHPKYNWILLSEKKATEKLHKQQIEQDWERAETLYQQGQIVSSQVIDWNRGGILVTLGVLQGFIPASHLSLESQMAQDRSEDPADRFQSLVGRTLQAKVIGIKRRRNRLILSEKEAMRELRKDAILEELEVGEVRAGVVSSLANFGAFINIGGADGLIHVSELSWSMVNHPSEVLTVGQQVQVKVISVEKERERIGLSLRQLQPRPWDTLAERYKEGNLVRAVITRIKDFGAFARLAGEPVEGLIHISEMSHERIERADQVVTVGEEYEVKIIRLDTQRRRIGLSIKQADLDWIIAPD